ncbi:hypothetical protein MMC08_007264 [Hypocenomyce scalaris]|nr:hypothetical protein [Hypocenomyce scalaris]
MLSLQCYALALLLTLTTPTAVPLQLRSTPSLTTAQLLAISPGSSTCAGAPYPSECRTAAQAVPFISASFSSYDLTSPAEMAAVVGTMAFESGDFKYDINYYPGNPGQGTRNMQSAAFNLLYASSIPALSSSLQAITAGATSASSLSTTQQNDVRGLLTANETYDFGSGAWFLTSQCTESVRGGLQNGSEEGWEEYITGCIGTTVTSDRMAYWQMAMQAFGASA